MTDIFNIKVKKTLLALIVLFDFFIPLSRLISPQTLIDGKQIYLAWLPLSVMYATICIFLAVTPLPP